MQFDFTVRMLERLGYSEAIFLGPKEAILYPETPYN